jgi:phosphate transport system substrate-binding protein
MSRFSQSRWVSCLAVTALVMTGCGGGKGGDGGSDTKVSLSGGGATFVDPIMQAWSHEYYESKGAKIDYSKSGSSDGIKQMTEGNLDFGCSDAPMKKDQVAAAKEKGGDVIHVPLIMGAVAVAYNLPDVPSLKLTGPIVAEIYLGKITKWNDKAIADINPGMKLPDVEIVPVYRSEGSGTSNIFTEYLNKVSPAFAQAIPASTQPKWPQIGLGQKGNDGVAGHVKKNVGCIGYVEVSFAKLNGLPTAMLQNAKGKFVAPEAEGVIAAAEWSMQQKQVKEPYSLHENTFSLTNAEVENAYPICGISYGLLYKKQKDAAKGKAIVEFFKWATGDGQKFAKDLHYAPLPADLTKAIAKSLGQVE